MTNKEFLRLWAMPEDIRRRRARAEKLRQMIEQAPAVAEAVKSSVDAGNATVLGHTIVRGTWDTSAYRAQLAALEAQIEEKNRAYMQAYPEAVSRIEAAADPGLRAALHLVCLEGCTWDEAAARLGRGSAESWRKAVTRFLEKSGEGRGPEYRRRGG